MAKAFGGLRTGAVPKSIEIDCQECTGKIDSVGFPCVDMTRDESRFDQFRVWHEDFASDFVREGLASCQTPQNEGFWGVSAQLASWMAQKPHF